MTQLSRRQRERMGLLAVVMLTAAVLSHARFSAWMDGQLHDVFSRWLPARTAPAQIVMIDLDERSLAEIGPWPWSRPVVARLIEQLQQQRVRLQVWDMLFPESADGDERIQSQLDAGAAAPVLWGQVPVIDPLVDRPPATGSLRSSAGAPAFCSVHPPISGQLGVASSLKPVLVGHLAATPDVDGRLRRLPAVLCRGAERYPQLVLAAAQLLEPDADWELHAGSLPFGPPRWLERGALHFPLDEQGYLYVPFQRPHSSWPAYSAVQVLSAPAGSLNLSGAVVIVGSSALGLGDTVSTPFHPNAPGVSAHAELLAAALDHSWSGPVRSPAWVSVLLVAVGLLLVPRFSVHNRGLWMAAAVAIVLSAPALIALLARLAGTQWPVTAPSLALLCHPVGLLLLQAGAERREARRLAAHLESFLPHGLAQDIVMQNPSSESLGKPCQGVLLALRVSGLERWITSVDSLQGLAMVHAVSTLAERSARLHGGALEHLQGEVFLMAWPEDGQKSVSDAIRCAGELSRELTSLLLRNESEPFPLGVRAAIESGAFLLGVVGSRASRRSLLLGPLADAVLAMLDLCDELASPILVGELAAGAVAGGGLRPMGSFLLPDRPKAQQLYRVDA